MCKDKTAHEQAYFSPEWTLSGLRCFTVPEYTPSYDGKSARTSFQAAVIVEGQLNTLDMLAFGDLADKCVAELNRGARFCCRVFVHSYHACVRYDGEVMRKPDGEMITYKSVSFIISELHVV